MLGVQTEEKIRLRHNAIDRLIYSNFGFWVVTRDVVQWNCYPNPCWCQLNGICVHIVIRTTLREECRGVAGHRHFRVERYTVVRNWRPKRHAKRNRGTYWAYAKVEALQRTNRKDVCIDKLFFLYVEIWQLRQWRHLLWKLFWSQRLNRCQTLLNATRPIY